MQPPDDDVASLRQQAEDLRQTLDAIQRGDVDALVVSEGPDTHRVLALQDLRREATALEEAQAAAHMGSWEWDPVNDLTVLSKEGQRIWRVPPAPLRLPDFLSRVHPADKNLVANFAQDLLRPEPAAPILVRLAYADRETHVRIRGTVTHRDGRGRPLRVAGTVEDVTEDVERLEAEVRLRAEADAARETFQSIVENAAEGIVQSSLAGEPLYVNPAGVRILGYASFEDLRSSIRSMAEIYADQADRGRFLQSVLAGKNDEFLTILRRKDGGRVHVGLKAKLMTRPDGSKHLLGVMRDRTSETHERHLLQERMKTLQILDQVQEITKAGAWELDIATGKVSWTREMYRIHEVGQDFPLENPDHVMQFYGEADRKRMAAAQREMMATARPYDLELGLVTPRGTRKTLRALAVPKVEGGKVVRIIGYVADITEQKEAEVARLELERQNREVARLKEISRMRMEFLNNAAHDLNTPLTPLKIALAVFRLGSSNLTPEQMETLDLVDRNVMRFQVLVQDMLDASRLQGGRLKLRKAPTPLAPLIEEAASSFAETAAQAGLTLTVEPMPPVVAFIDRDKTSQVLFNLVSNAVKYTPRGGVTIRVAAAPGEARVSISDTGLGLAADDLSRLFQPFVRVHEGVSDAKGTGLGLYISKGIIEQQGGRIWVESPGPGAGSTFTIALPLDRGKAPAPAS